MKNTLQTPTQQAINSDPRTVSDHFEHIPYFSFGLLKARMGESWFDGFLTTLGKFEAEIEAKFPADDED